MNSPIFCHEKAYTFLEAQLAQLNEPEAFLNAAIALGMHEFPQTDPKEVHHELERHAQMIQSRYQGPSQRAALAHLHEYLFEELKFTGDTDDYYQPRNSYVHRVLELKKGLPITLSLVYREIARRLGLTVHGIGSPGHFHVEVQIDHRHTLIDPFHQGKMLTRLEAHERAELATGQSLPKSNALFPRVSHEAWLSRMILNLEHAFTMSGRENDVMAMVELRHLLEHPEA